jgi:hypothetical protein
MNNTENTYNPARLLDVLTERMRVKNDAGLSRLLDISKPQLSKIRNSKLPVGASILIRMHEVTRFSILELREMMGDRRAKYRYGEAWTEEQRNVFRTTGKRP